MQKIIDLELNYFDTKIDHNDLMRAEFYKAKDYVFSMGYDTYIETKSLPLDPKNHHIFTPLSTFRVKDTNGNYDTINIYARALGGMLITNEM